ncbi:MAG TPA: LysE family transporter [Verrucomicrobiae bacterium]|jgi:threonine/homoserine/homoserine lactone efflux protein|nr:LysE family transporter [Verrucomicrobiae bacterium]
MVGLFLKGFVIGMIVSVPVGPIGLLCVNRTLSKGPVYGLTSGLGVATADAISGGIVVLGLTLVSSFLIAEQIWLRLVGGFFLCYLGCKIFVTEPAPRSMADKEKNLLGAYASTFLLTFSNPLTLLSFVAIYAGWGVEDLSAHHVLAAVLTVGIFCGSASWWVILSTGMPVVRMMFTHEGLRWVHRVSGAIIAGFGFIILMTLVQRLSG